MTFRKSLCLPVPFFFSSSPVQGTIQTYFGKTWSLTAFKFPEALVKWSCSLVRWQFPNHLFISAEHQVIYIATNATSDLSSRILKAVQTAKLQFPWVKVLQSTSRFQLQYHFFSRALSF